MECNAEYGDAHNELGCLLLLGDISSDKHMSLIAVTLENKDAEAIESFEKAKMASRLTARHTPAMNLGALYHAQQVSHNCGMVHPA